MKIKVTQEKLSKALNNVSRIAIGKVTLPILNNVLIRVDNKKVSLITTNLDMAIIDFLPVSSSEDGIITVPAKLLTEFVSNLPKGEPIEITSTDTKVTISAGKYSSTINGSVADDFPELPEIDDEKAVVYKMGVDEFKASVGQVMTASSSDLSRPALTGVFFNTIDQSLAIAATDGYRLTEKKLIDKVESEVRAIVPAGSLQEVLRAINDEMEEIEISFNDDLVRFRLGEVEIISKLIDSSYPDYRQLMPKNSNIKVTVSRDEAIRVARLAALFARSTNNVIVCESTPPNSFSVHSVANEFGENSSTIETPTEVAGKINVNSRYLIDALNTFDEKTITLEFAEKSPVVIKNQQNDNYTHVVMPINL